MEELVRRLSAGSDRLTILLMMPQPTVEMWPQALEPGFSHVEALKKDGYSEGTVGAVQTLFFRAAEGGWTQEQLRTEVQMGAWFVFPADAAIVFNSDPDSLWKQMIQNSELRWAQNGTS